MLFTEFEFIFLFLPAALFFFERFRSTARKIQFLVLASLIFYGVWDYRFLFLILGSVILNFFLGKYIARHPSRLRLSLGIFLNLTPLVFYKYSRFLLDNLGMNSTALDEMLPNVLPLGISFYTFQQIAYLVDVYKHSELEPSFCNYAFFTTFFPQLIAGPIVHHRELIPQIGQTVDRQSLFFNGLCYFAIGFFKKFYIADNLALLVDPIYASPFHLETQASLIAILGYSFQLYFDFSGYSDMAMGLAGLFGFTLPINFMSPYKSKSIVEFWRRWHITLSHFLRDYLYIPLGGNQHGKLSRYRNLMLTMLVGGLWHGAGWAFVVWGGLHGLALAIHQFCKDRFPRGRVGIWGYPLTFLFVALAWVPFRAESLKTSMEIYKGLWHWGTFRYLPEYAWLFLGAVVVLGPSSHQIVARWSNLPQLLQSYLFSLRVRMFAYVSCAYALTVAGMVSFYTTDIDRDVYRFLNVPVVGQGISNKDGDFRSNLRVMEIMSGNEQKVCVVGSSFTTALGSYRFEKEGIRYKSGTAGIGGNGLINGLRTAMAVMDEPNMNTIILGISPLNLGPITTHCAFPNEGMEGIDALGFNLKCDRLRSCRPVSLTAQDVFSLATQFRSKDYAQMHGFFHKISTVYNSPHRPSRVEEFSLKDQEQFLQEFDSDLSKLRAQTKRLPDQTNGENARFRWENRGILESLEPNGDVFCGLKNLKAECDRRGIRFVIYESPTPSHAEAPHIYPKYFLEVYQQKMQAVCQRLEISYIDLSALFPFNGICMSDFIHPQFSYRPKLHKLLIFQIFGAPSNTIAAIPNYRLLTPSGAGSVSPVAEQPTIATKPKVPERNTIR